MIQRIWNYILGVLSGPPTHWVLLVRGPSNNVWLIEHTNREEAYIEKAALEARSCYVEVYARTNSIRGDERLLPPDAEQALNGNEASEERVE